MDQDLAEVFGKAEKRESYARFALSILSFSSNNNVHIEKEAKPGGGSGAATLRWPICSE
jgi:hypothetical protein